ncbi:MAG: DegT/DnrJ/EryC1/StrS family aminotransferase, partial [archaeon]|nr:DegT/DnrJ/EryC1/StrS family aminotransferase [archaeon]
MIPFVNLTRNESLNLEIKEACLNVLNKGLFIFGPELEKFEKRFASFCEKEYTVGVANGTDAITLALKAYDIQQGDEVITASNTAIPTVAAIVNAGAKPVLIDIDKNYLIEPSNLEKRITGKSKAIVPVHLYGRVCRMDEILKIARQHNLHVIEDCAQAHGATYQGGIVPIGETGCFSFYPSKNLGCYGDGGAIVTSSPEIAEKIKLLRNYGQSDRYHAKIHGQNSRLDEMQAAILNVRLNHLNEFNKLRRMHATAYGSLLNDAVITPEIENRENSNIFHLYVIRTEKRDELAAHLKEKGIGTAIHYPIPIHLQEA